MAFIEHIPFRSFVKDDFSIRSIKTHPKSIVFSATKIFFEKLNISAGDKVKFFYDNDKNTRWMIEKTDLNNTGYKVAKAGKRLKIQIKLKIPGIDVRIIKLKDIELKYQGLVINILEAAE